MMSHGTLKFQIAIWALKPTSIKKTKIIENYKAQFLNTKNIPVTLLSQAYLH